MAEFLTTNGVSLELEKLIKNSEEKLYLVTPYLQISSPLKDLIRERNLLKTDIIFIVRENEKHNLSDVKFLQDLSRVTILTSENLHAKCYLNEKTAIITSMNLYQYSQQNNKEMGLKIENTNDTDSKLYADILAEVKSIIRTSKYFPSILDEKKKESQRKSSTIQSKNSGFCIRCAAPMELNPNKPLCSKCYPIWANHSNPDYEEKFCHMCGKPSKQSYAKPVCYNCYKKLK